MYSTSIDVKFLDFRFCLLSIMVVYINAVDVYLEFVIRFSLLLFVLRPDVLNVITVGGLCFPVEVRLDM
jgi:hypothetical protein